MPRASRGRDSRLVEAVRGGEGLLRCLRRLAVLERARRGPLSQLRVLRRDGVKPCRAHEAAILVRLDDAKVDRATRAVAGGGGRSCADRTCHDSSSYFYSHISLGYHYHASTDVDDTCSSVGAGWW